MSLEPDALWKRLVEEARQAPPETLDVPYGFTTRVVARWRATPEPTLLAAMNGLLRRSLLGGMALLLACAAFCCWPTDRPVDSDLEWTGSPVSLEDLL